MPNAFTPNTDLLFKVPDAGDYLQSGLKAILDKQEQDRQFRNDVAKAGGTVQPDTGPFFQIPDWLKRLRGQSVGQPQSPASPPVTNQVPGGGAANAPIDIRPATVPTGAAGVNTTIPVPVPRGQPAPTIGSRIGDVIAGAASPVIAGASAATSQAPPRLAGGGDFPAAPGGPVRTDQPPVPQGALSIGDMLNTTIEGPSGQKATINPYRGELVKSAIATDQAERTAAAAAGIKDWYDTKKETDEVNALVAQGMDRNEAIARVRSNTVGNSTQYAKPPDVSNSEWRARALYASNLRLREIRARVSAGTATAQDRQAARDITRVSRLLTDAEDRVRQAQASINATQALNAGTGPRTNEEKAQAKIAQGELQKARRDAQTYGQQLQSLGNQYDQPDTGGGGNDGTDTEPDYDTDSGDLSVSSGSTAPITPRGGAAPAPKPKVTHTTQEAVQRARALKQRGLSIDQIEKQMRAEGYNVTRSGGG